MRQPDNMINPTRVLLAIESEPKTEAQVLAALPDTSGLQVLHVFKSSEPPFRWGLIFAFAGVNQNVKDHVGYIIKKLGGVPKYTHLGWTSDQDRPLEETLRAMEMA